MNKFLKTDVSEHLLKRFDGNSFLVLVAFHFVADQMQPVEHIQNWINHCRWPCHDQRTARREDSIRFAKYLLGLGEMLQNSKHHDLIETGIRQGKRLTQIAA